MWKEQARPRVSCSPPGETVGRRDRPRRGAVCPFGRLVSGGGDHITGDRPRPDPVWEPAGFSVPPAPTALLRLCPFPGDCPDTPQRRCPCPATGPDTDAPASTHALRSPPALPPPCRGHLTSAQPSTGARCPREALRTPGAVLARAPPPSPPWPTG